MKRISDLFSLQGKVALITGASSGLGWRFAEVLSEAGARLVLMARRKERLDKLHRSLASRGYPSICLKMDISDSDSIETQINNALEYEPSIDILVNNAGVLKQTPLFEERAIDFDEVFKVNVRGLWLVTQKVAKHMRDKKNHGSIINIASISGALVPSYDESAYCASKAAVIQLTKQLVGELSKYQIRINAILPGIIHTEMTHNQIDQEKGEIEKAIPLGFVGKPEDLDGAILYLASNKASRYVTGSSITVDGGDSWRGV
jgi:NAD(P)-dependent dehydrogenase (short-subunit alcohol dehydrogenase family)